MWLYFRCTQVKMSAFMWECGSGWTSSVVDSTQCWLCAAERAAHRSHVRTELPVWLPPSHPHYHKPSPANLPLLYFWWLRWVTNFTLVSVGVCFLVENCFVVPPSWLGTGWPALWSHYVTYICGKGNCSFHDARRDVLVRHLVTGKTQHRSLAMLKKFGWSHFNFKGLLATAPSWLKSSFRLQKKKNLSAWWILKFQYLKSKTKRDKWTVFVVWKNSLKAKHFCTEWYSLFILPL